MKGTVLITGASGNLGGAVLNKFLDRGYRIAALDTPRSASMITETDRVKSFPVDLMDEQRVNEVVKEVYTAYGSIDMAVFTAGGFAMGNIVETGTDTFEKMYRLNFITAYTIARQLFIRIAKQDGGQMVFIGSRPSLHPEQAKNMIAYSLTKSLLFRLAEVINEDGSEVNVRASVIIPGIIDTPQNRIAMPDADFTKWVSPTEIAENIYHLTTTAGRKLRESIIKIYGDS